MTDLGTSVFIDLTGEYSDKSTPSLVSGSSNADCSEIVLIFDSEMINPAVAHVTDFLIFEDNRLYRMEIIGAHYGDNLKTWVIINVPYSGFKAPVTLRYPGTNITSLAKVPLAQFTGFDISIPKSK